MPVYVYKCDSCGVTFERKQSVTDQPLHDCPECDGYVRRVYQPVGVVFKGSGWYVNDSRGHKATTEPASSSSSSSSDSTKADSEPATPSPSTETSKATEPAKAP